MPTLPWSAGPTETSPTVDEIVVMASRFELTTFRQVLPFFVAALRVRGQVRRADGAIGVALVAHPLRREFYTLSAWRDRAAIEAMITAEPHRSVMTGFRDHTADASFTFWTIPSFERPTWTDAHRRLEVASGRGNN